MIIFFINFYPTKNQQGGLTISRHVNFGFTGSSKPVEVLVFLLFDK